MVHSPGAQRGYRRIPLRAEEKARGEANFAPLVAQMLVASGRFGVSADTPDQVELFQGVARRVSDMLQRPVVSYANGREIVITFGQEEAPVLELRSPGWGLAGAKPRLRRTTPPCAATVPRPVRWLRSGVRHGGQHRGRIAQW
ncbi:MAG TPA: hypothetical protein VK284_07255 [Streptosporangiaceae bacterium]|nr:hypothetical protein [Streptosporangiaceae bacterium]